jgi:hypothetical protein
MNPNLNFAKLGLVAAIAIPLAACGTSGPYKRMSDGEATIAPGNGVLVFSSLKDNDRSIMWDYVIASPATNEYGALGREARWPKGYYALPCGRLGNIVAASLKPGDYTFGPWTLDLTLITPGVGYVVASSHNPHGPVDARIPFSIRAGAITYVGEVHVDEAGSRATVSDDWACDQPYIHATWPMLGTWPVTKAIAPFPGTR